MSKQTYPRDRFDELPAQSGRVGAHRTENPHMRGWVVFLWAATAALVLVAAGVFGTLVASGRIDLTVHPTATPTPTPTVTPVLDTSFNVLVLNATPVEGLSRTMADAIVAAGFKPAQVSAGAAGSNDFRTTTVFYSDDEDEAAAAGLAQAIGGAEIAQSDDYVQGETKQLTVVIGLDRVTEPSPSPTP